MALLIKRICESYIRSMTENADPRTNDWFMVASPIPCTFICLVYVVFVLDVGPKYMENREPFNLKKAMIFYNVLQIVVNAYIVIKASFYMSSLDIRCSAVDYSYDEAPMNLAKLTWMYFMVKIADLVDTVFFVLRKKSNQISFLHVYHHFGIAFVGWIGSKYIAGGHSIYLGYVNSFVHVIMYCYYLLSIINKKISKNVTLKKLVTQLQLIQFVVLFCIYFQILFRQNCGYPVLAIIPYLPQNVVMIILFSDFYYKTYIKKKIEVKLED